MLGKRLITLIAMVFMVAMIPAAVWAESTKYDACSGANLNADFKGISKTKPTSAQVLKVRPFPGISAGFGSMSGLNPMNWWQQCCLPMPAQRQFVIAPRMMFARVHGEVRRAGRPGGTPDSLVDFDDQLGLGRPGSPVWTFSAHYQFQPRWGIRYSLTPLKMEVNHEPKTAFTLGGQSFTGGSLIHSKWQRYEHRTGLVFDLSRTTGGATSLFADWMYIQEKLSVGTATGTGPLVTIDDDKSMAVLGIEFSKCLKNYRGNTLAFGAKGGIAFLGDAFGYEAEASLNYLIPVKRGRFGFVKGGYRYATLKKEKAPELFKTSIDGAFLEVGFLF